MMKVRDNGRREVILRIAAKRFRERGFERTSVREIAEIAGMTSGSLFYYFTSKEELLVAIMDEGVRDIIQSVGEGAAGQRALPERLLDMLRCHLKALLGPHLDAMTVLLYEWRSLSPRARGRVLAALGEYERLWAQPLGEAAALGLVNSDTVLVRQTVLGALNWTAQWYRPDGRLDVDSLAKRMFAVLLPQVARCASNLSVSEPMEMK